jgi:hypothetical protein
MQAGHKTSRFAVLSELYVAHANTSFLLQIRVRVETPRLPSDLI